MNIETLAHAEAMKAAQPYIEKEPQHRDHYYNYYYKFYHDFFSKQNPSNSSNVAYQTNLNNTGQTMTNTAISNDVSNPYYTTQQNVYGNPSNNGVNQSNTTYNTQSQQGWMPPPSHPYQQTPSGMSFQYSGTQQHPQYAYGSGELLRAQHLAGTSNYNLATQTRNMAWLPTPHYDTRQANINHGTGPGPGSGPGAGAGQRAGPGGFQTTLQGDVTARSAEYSKNVRDTSNPSMKMQSSNNNPNIAGIQQNVPFSNNRQQINKVSNNMNVSGSNAYSMAVQKKKNQGKVKLPISTLSKEKTNAIHSNSVIANNKAQAAAMSISQRLQEKSQQKYTTETSTETNRLEDSIPLSKSKRKRQRAKARKQGEKNVSDENLNSSVSQQKLTDRAKRFKRENDKLNSHGAKVKFSNDLIRRAGDGTLGFGFKTHRQQDETTEDEIDWDSLTIKGTCQTLSKRYFRLTAPPDPADVRPEPVLCKALDWVIQQLRNGETYVFVNDQLKSIRQDLVVQHIKNNFCIKVYETHARIALEYGDINEFNQCQTQLYQLYKNLELNGNRLEFLAYRILYLLYSNSHTRSLQTLNSISSDDKKDNGVSHAIDVFFAVLHNNYHRFFMLHKTAPRMAGWLMDHLAWKMQLRGFTAMANGYRPNIDLGFVAHELGYENDSMECKRHLEHAGGQVKEMTIENKHTLVFDTRISTIRQVKPLKALEANPLF